MIEDDNDHEDDGGDEDKGDGDDDEGDEEDNEGEEGEEKRQQLLLVEHLLCTASAIKTCISFHLKSAFLSLKI